MRPYLAGMWLVVVLGCAPSDADLAEREKGDRQEKAVSKLVADVASRHHADTEWHGRFFSKAFKAAPLEAKAFLESAPGPVVLQIFLVEGVARAGDRNEIVGYDMLLPLGTLLRLECTETDAAMISSQPRHRDLPAPYFIVDATLSAVELRKNAATGEHEGFDVRGRCLEVVPFPVVD
jgi:hypothetical protein